jgi:hypothetical protein
MKPHTDIFEFTHTLNRYICVHKVISGRYIGHTLTIKDHDLCFGHIDTQFPTLAVFLQPAQEGLEPILRQREHGKVVGIQQTTNDAASKCGGE